MKKIVLAILAVAVLAVPVTAEVQTYEDEFVSFQYDDEIEGFIDRVIYEDSIYYDLLEGGTYSRIDICFTDKTREQLRNAISGGMMESKALVDDGDVLAVVCHDVDAENAFWPLLSESVMLKDDLALSGLSMRSNSIYKNYPYSDQAINYAKRALEICDQYLAFELDGKEAGRQIEEVAKRVKSFIESSDDAGDEDVYFTVAYKEMTFRLNNDGRIMDMKSNLEMILANAE